MNTTYINYKFKNVINCLLEIDTIYVNKLVPKNIYPLEIQPNLSLISIIGFDFYDTPIGDYQEVIIGIITQPYFLNKDRIPKSAVFPINVATNTDKSKEHAIANYKLPHYMKNIIIDFNVNDSKKILTCKDNDKIFLNVELNIKNNLEKTEEYHQSFIADHNQLYLSEINIDAILGENQDGEGKVTLSSHKFFKNIEINEINNIPYLERYAHTGIETMSSLISIKNSI